MNPRRTVLLASLFLVALLEVPAVRAETPALEGDLYISAVRAWIDQGDYAAARKWLKKRMKESADPDDQYGYLYCLYQEGSYARVLAAARSRSHAHVMSQRRSMILRGLALWRLGQHSGAFQSWMSVLAANPDDDLALECLYVGALSLPRTERVDAFTYLIGASTRSRFATSFFRGLLDALRGHRESAEKRLVEARELSPESPTAARALREFYRQNGMRAKARELNEWLVSRGEHRGATLDDDKTNSISDLYGTQAVYRLPWPGGRTFFCPSHEGVRDTPHKDRGRYALDFYLPPGTPIIAARGGVVRNLDGQPDALGDREFETFVLIDHGDGTFARYYHLSGGSVRVAKGDIVRNGQVLAASGRSGRCQSRHLHFEVLRKARFRPQEPHMYRFWETIPVDFEETRHLKPEQIPGRWIASRNLSLR